MSREAAERCTILRGLVGSTVHGLNVNDGIEDRDEMGVCVEPMQDAMALWSPFEQFRWWIGPDDADAAHVPLDELERAVAGV